VTKRDAQVATHGDYFEEAYVAGHHLALDECVISCAESKSSLPQWALQILADRSWRRLEEADRELRAQNRKLPPISFYLLRERQPRRATRNRDRGGRGRHLDHLRRSLLVGYVMGARELGLRGDAAFELAIEFLQAEFEIEYSLSSARKLYPKLRAAYAPHESVVPTFAGSLDLFRADRRAKETSRVSSSRVP
jgi:hypothetical protein